MTEMEISGVTDAAVEHLRRSRRSDAVLKMKVVQVRGYCPKTPLLAFEGDDDKIVYAQWLRRIRPDLVYEPFPCSGKSGVLALREIAQRDLSGLGEGIYYFVDRDFDDLRGQLAGDDVFLTDRYSVENYLVESAVVDQILTAEVHCHGRPDIRAELVSLFEKRYAEFLDVTAPLNRRIFISRRSGTPLDRHLPASVSAIATVTIGAVTAARTEPEVLAPFANDIDPTTEAQLSSEFEKLDPHTRFRGKFAYMFLLRWLGLIVEEYRTGGTTHFKDMDRTARVRTSEFTLGGIASKSPIPEHLLQFVGAIA